MKIIVYKTEIGIAIIHPAGSIENCMKDIPEEAEYKIIDESELPKDTTFRNSWGFDLKEDIPKLKEIKKDMLRADRELLFKQLDIDFMRASELNDTDKINEIAAEKTRLRDITKKVDSCKTIKQIKAIKIGV